MRALDWIFARPIFKSTAFIDGSDIPKPTASRILRVLRDEDFLVEVREASGRRPAILACRRLLNIAEGKDAF
jgi:DNA-binding IclR family transcriptional regulator